MWLALVNGAYAWDWARAETGYKQALELNPNLAYGRGSYAFFLTLMGRHQAAMTEAKRAQELSPFDLLPRTYLGRVLYFSRHYDEAIELLRNTIHMNPYQWIAYDLLGIACLEKGMYEEAIVALQKAITLPRGYSRARANLGRAFAMSGRKKEAWEILDKLKRLSTERYVSPLAIASIHVSLGEKDRAFQWLGKAYDVRDGDMWVIKVAPFLDPLRTDPRFQDLLRRMGFPD